jgi:hypothetical protein
MLEEKRLFLDPELQKLSDHYYVGRILPRVERVNKLNRVIGYEKVISFDVPSKYKWSQFSVTVIACDRFGMPIKGAKEIIHCKNPFIK